MRFVIVALFVLSCGCSLTAQVDVREGYQLIDRYQSTDGYYLFLPSQAVQAEHDSLQVSVFLHGYGGLNPLNYGGWLQAMLDAGSVVVYPRYQRNLFSPGPKKFVRNAVQGISAGLAELEGLNLPLQLDTLHIFGHSYGAVISSTLLAQHGEFALPPFATAFLVAPGTNRFKGGRLASYEDLPLGLKLIVLSHEDDSIVGDEFPRLLHETSPVEMNRVWLHQSAGNHLDESYSATHNECYSPLEAFDSGYRNYTTRKALRVGREDAIDTDLVYKLSLELLASTQRPALPEVLTAPLEHYDLGTFADGTPREGIELRYPQATARAAAETRSQGRQTATSLR